MNYCYLRWEHPFQKKTSIPENIQQLKPTLSLFVQDNSDVRGKQLFLIESEESDVVILSHYMDDNDVPKLRDKTLSVLDSMGEDFLTSVKPSKNKLQLSLQQRRLFSLMVSIEDVGRLKRVEIRLNKKNKKPFIPNQLSALCQMYALFLDLSFSVCYQADKLANIASADILSKISFHMLESMSSPEPCVEKLHKLNKIEKLKKLLFPHQLINQLKLNLQSLTPVPNHWSVN